MYYRNIIDFVNLKKKKTIIIYQAFYKYLTNYS